MEGLEATEISRSKLNDELRYESEFFKKRYLLEDSEVALFERVMIGAFATVTVGPHGYHIVDDESPIAMLTAKCAKDWFSDRTFAETISKSIDQANQRSSLQENDIILSTRGTVGMCALVTKETLPANIDQYIARISWSDKNSLLPEFVLAYLNSSFGQDYMERHASGMVQRGMSLQKVRNIPLPILSREVQQSIAMVVQSALLCRRNSEKSLANANKQILSGLGLESWQPPVPLIYVRPSGEAFAAGRLDAEHFQPKFTEVVQLIKSTNQFQALNSLVLINQRGTQPIYTSNGALVVNSKHVINGEVRIDADNRLAMLDKYALKIEPGDVLINGTGVGTIGRAAPYLHDFNAIPDNHVTVLRPCRDVIDPIYLAVFLNSLAGRMQVEQRLRGSSGQIEIYPSDLGQFTIWVAPTQVQQEIRSSVLASFAAKQKANQFLDAAKRAVEIAIESSESDALAFLDQTLAEAREANS